MLILIRHILIATLLLTSAGMPAPAFADDIVTKDKERIKEFGAKVKEYERELRAVKGKEKSVFGELKYIQKILEKRKAQLRDAEIKMDDAELKINGAFIRVTELKAKTSMQKKQLSSRAATLYMLSDMQYLKILFSSGSYVDMLKRYKYLRLIIDQDADLIREYGAARDELEIAMSLLKKEKEILDETAKKVKNRELEILAEQNTKRILLLKVSREKDYYLKAIKELKVSSKKLEELILKLEKDSADSKYTYKEKFKDFKKVLESPVDGTVVSFFGKELVSRLDSYLFNNGIRFAVDIGHEVVSVFKGEIIYSDWFRGYGKVVIISHGDGYYTIYSHLAEFFKEKGDQAHRGEVIATSGDTGSLTGPGLYFEIRYKGRSLDPLDWLEPTVDSTRKARVNAR